MGEHFGHGSEELRRHPEQLLSSESLREWKAIKSALPRALLIIEDQTPSIETFRDLYGDRIDKVQEGINYKQHKFAFENNTPHFAEAASVCMEAMMHDLFQRGALGSCLTAKTAEADDVNRGIDELLMMSREEGGYESLGIDFGVLHFDNERIEEALDSAHRYLRAKMQSAILRAKNGQLSSLDYVDMGEAAGLPRGRIEVPRSVMVISRSSLIDMLELWNAEDDEVAQTKLLKHPIFSVLLRQAILQMDTYSKLGQTAVTSKFLAVKKALDAQLQKRKKEVRPEPILGKYARDPAHLAMLGVMEELSAEH